jgi:hypothetical protein
MITEIFLNLSTPTRKQHLKGMLCWLLLHLQKETYFKKSCSLCGRQGHKSVNCFSRLENAHKKPGFKAIEKALTTTAPTSKSCLTCTYCQKPGHAEKRCYKKKNDEGKTNDKAAVMFMVTEHEILTKAPSHTLTNNTFLLLILSYLPHARLSGRYV